MRITIAWVLVILAGLTSAGCEVGVIRIQGSAMAPTLNDGDRRLLSRHYPGDVLTRGAVVAFRYPRDPSKNFVMRIVGLPGERVEIVKGAVSVDGKPLEEPYVAEENRSNEHHGPLVIPPGEYFVMGDNRRNASDSRSWGTVSGKLVWGEWRR
jgi:signal peptidase I